MLAIAPLNTNILLFICFALSAAFSLWFASFFFLKDYQFFQNTMQRMVLEQGVRPTLVARPEETFRSTSTDQNASSSPSEHPNVPTPAKVSFEQYTSSSQDKTQPAPWNSQEALLQLKLALKDTPKLRSLSAVSTAGSTAEESANESFHHLKQQTSTSPSIIDVRKHPLAAVKETVFVPPVVRYNSTVASSSSTSSTSAATEYARRTLHRIQAACTRLEEQFHALCEGKAEKDKTSEAAASDVLWAQVTQGLHDPALVHQLQRRAAAAIWEKECAYRVNDLLKDELRRRGVPAEAALEDFEPFLAQVQRSRTFLEAYLSAQETISTLAPMLEAAAERASCLTEIAALTSSAGAMELEGVQRDVDALSEQVKEDAGRLHANVAALQKRLDALKKTKQSAAVQA